MLRDPSHTQKPWPKINRAFCQAVCHAEHGTKEATQRLVEDDIRAQEVIDVLLRQSEQSVQGLKRPAEDKQILILRRPN